jgi:hypothetical protein
MAFIRFSSDTPFVNQSLKFAGLNQHPPANPNGVDLATADVLTDRPGR